MSEFEGSANSMSILNIVLSIIVFGGIFVFFTVPMNSLIDLVNNGIALGQLSEDTTRFFDIAIKYWKSSPFFFLVGLILYSFERSKGTDIPIQTFFSYIVLMMGGIILSCILVYAYGFVMDNMINAIYTLPSTYNMTEVWGESMNKTNILLKILYYSCLLPAFTTSILFMFHPVIRQKENVSFTEEYEGGFNLKQY